MDLLKQKITWLLLIILLTVLQGCSSGGGGDPDPVTQTPDPVTDAFDDNATTTVNNSVTITVLQNDTVANGGSLSVASTTQGTNGSVAQNGDNTLTYTPNSGFIGGDSFTYTIEDGLGGTDTATVTVTVNQPNTPPVANDDSTQTTTNTAVEIAVLSNDTDADGDTLSVTDVTQGTNGSVSINGGSTVTYTPNNGYVGGDSFTYTLSDGNGGIDTATVTVNVNNPGTGPYLGYAVGTTVYAVDKNNPASVSSITSDVFDVNSIGYDVNHTNKVVFFLQKLTVNISTTSFTFGSPEMLVYAGSDNFWKVDLSAGSNLTPVALLTSNYSELCKIEFDSDPLTLENSLLFYELPGADGLCTGVSNEAADNVRWMLQVSSSSSHSPINITAATDNLESLVVVRNTLANNSVLGFIASIGNEIRHYNASFGSPSPIITAADVSDLAANNIEFSEYDSTGGFMKVDRVVYWYDFVNQTLSGALHTISATRASSDMSCDATECFFTTTEQIGSPDDFVFRLPADGSGAATPLATVTGGFGSTSSEIITPDYIYVANGDTHELFSIARSDGAVATVDTADSLFGGTSVGNHLYYNRGDVAVIRHFDGTLIDEIPQAAWSGMQVVSGNYETNLYTEGRVFLARKAVGNTTDFSGGTLESYNPITNTMDLVLGTLPTATTAVFMFGVGDGGMLGYLATGTGPAMQLDVLWVNANVADSFVRVTDDTQFKELFYFD